MNRYPYFVVLIICLMSCSYSNKNDGFPNEVLEIKSIDPANMEYVDLMPIRDAIGNSKVVLLGEQEHGDGSTYLAKSRLVKFLHYEMGFNVLAFEADFFGVNKSWEDYKRGVKSYQDVLDQMYIFWPQSQMCKDLFQTIEYSQKSKAPIFLAGLDNQQLSKVSKEELIPSLDSLISEYGVMTRTSDQIFFNGILVEAMNKFHDQEISMENQDRFLAILDNLVMEFRRKEIDPFWVQELRNIRGFVMHTWHWWIDREKDLVNNNHRDFQMANNCLWLLNEKYKGEKLIVWAANGHIIKTDTLFDVESEGWKPKVRQYPMGEVLFDRLGEDLYSIGFTSYQGESAFLEYDAETQDYLFTSYPFQPADKMSFEFELQETGFDYAFINLRNALGSGNQRIRIWRPEYVKGKLSNIYDGIFYIHDMKPNLKL